MNETSALVLGAGLTAVLAAVFFIAWRLAARRTDPFLLLEQQIEGLRRQWGESAEVQSRTVTDRLLQLSSELNRRLDAVAQNVLDSQRSVGERLDGAGRVVGEVQKSLGVLSEASERIFEVGRDIGRLQDILRAPKLRGGLGELLLADLLAQVLPSSHVIFQHGFRTGEKVDAVIRLGGRLVPVDAKFPLENFRRVWEAGTDEERRTARRRFLTDVKRHVDAIADRYIRPDEGTYEFAFMYIPAENVYYECVIKDDAGDDVTLAAYALERRVIPVSPGSFYAYLQAIALGLRGFQIEENARRIMDDLGRLRGDFGRFAEEFDVLGRHLTNAKTKHDDAGRKLERVRTKLASLEVRPEASVEPDPPPLPRP